MNSSCLVTVPPAPELLAQLYARYQELKEKRLLPTGMTFEAFYQFWRSSRRSEDFVGLDDGALRQSSSRDLQTITRPSKKLAGSIRTLVLLVDFEDRPNSGTRPPAFYQQMLFGDTGVFATGSMREFYRTVSNYSAGTSGIDIQGDVYGWFRMPQPLSYYTNDNSGMFESPPRNAQGMAYDAVQTALANGVPFEASHDVLGEGIITALFIVHAGRGAEETGSRDDIWSLKWVIPGGVPVGSGLTARTFLTVPEDCAMGVCAHEWGHLVARWADYYDTGNDDYSRSNGLGNYCLMASGSWGNSGITPTFPNGMLRMFHDWITPEVVTSSRRAIALKPAAEGGSILMIQNPATMNSKQYVFAEYRRRSGQDAYLPDEGLAIYLVDEDVDDVNDEDHLAIELMQADNRRDLARLFRTGNRGDASDLYPHGNKRTLGKTTRPRLKLANGVWTGITLKVKGKPGDPEMLVDVKIS